MLTDRSQRWRDRRDRYVPAATVIDPKAYSVDIIECMKTAKPFVLKQHYSQSFPASRLSCGLFRNGPAGRSELVGVATFSVPMNNAAITKHTGIICHRHGAELGRFVLLDSVPGNGESFFLSRAIKLLRREKPEIVSLISYADPMRRLGPAGNIIAPGHVGALYAVAGAHYRGRSSPRYEAFTPDGQLFSERALSKIRNAESGIGYAVDELVRRGAPHPSGNEREWLSMLFEQGFFTKRRHNGNHVYAFPLTKAAKMAGRKLPRLEYPVLDRSLTGNDVTALPLLQAA